MLELPSDILGLVLSYALVRRPVRWVYKHFILEKSNHLKYVESLPYHRMGYTAFIPDHITLLSNSAGIDWIIYKLDLTYLIDRDLNVSDEVEAFELISKNKSPKSHELYEKMIRYFGHDGSTCEFDIDTYSHDQLCDISEAMYDYVKNKFPDDFAKGIRTRYLRFIYKLLEMNKLIPELIEWYELNCKSKIGEEEMKLLAFNQYTWDIFINYAKERGDLIETYIKSICSNTSTKAIEYIGSNINMFKYCSNLYTNPSAYPLLINLDTTIPSTILENMCSNPNPQVIKLLEKYPQYICSKISANSTNEAVDILLANPNLIDYKYLSSNTNPRILPLLKANYDKLNLGSLYANPLIFPRIKFSDRALRKIFEICEQNTRTSVDSLINEHIAKLENQMLKNCKN